MSLRQHSPCRIIVTRWQTKKQNLTDTCAWTHMQPNSIMDPQQNKELKALLNDLVLSLKQDMTKES